MAITVAPPRADRRTRPLVLAALGAGLAWLAVVLFWSDAPFALTFDDAFYYFGIARNVAHGHGSTFDGINPTNGYHPLWQAICVLPRLVGLDGIGRHAGPAGHRTRLLDRRRRASSSARSRRPSPVLAAAVVLFAGQPVRAPLRRQRAWRRAWSCWSAPCS